MLILAIFAFPNKTRAETDCDDLSGSEERKCEELEKKAEAYQNLIELKNKQQNTLKNQLVIINSEQQKNRSEIENILEKSGDLERRISELEREISYGEEMMKYQKQILAGLLQSYYEYYKQGILGIVMVDKSLSDIVNQSDYLAQSSVRVQESLEQIRNVKEKLEKDQQEIIGKKEEGERLKKELQNRNSNLELSEGQKQNLLTQTKGEEAKYQKLLARVEQQKLELFNFGAAENIDEVNASVGSYPKPDSKYWASTSWYYSQRDSRWGNKTIGNSNSLMKDYGCAVTAASMVFKLHGASIDPGKMAKQKIYYYDLIKWPGSWEPSTMLASSTSHSGVNWKKVDSEIEDGHPVIVYIKKTNGGGGHYVVIHNKDDDGKYVVHDPYFGSNLFLTTSQSLFGALGKNSKTIIDQMILYK